MGLFFYTKKGSIISTVDLPTTEIIEPFFHEPENRKANKTSGLFFHEPENRKANKTSGLFFHEPENRKANKSSGLFFHEPGIKKNWLT